MQIQTLTPDRYADAADLFLTNPSTRGCWCQHPLLTVRETTAGWGAGNQERFRTMAGSEPPAGLLAYHNGQTVGWCATGPRARFTRALRSSLMATRRPDEDESVWLVPCFFVRSGHRRTGITHELLQAAVALSRQYNATAIEGFPLAGPGPHKADRYYGTEPLFTACGFRVIQRPTAGRAIMQLTHHGQRSVSQGGNET